MLGPIALLLAAQTPPALPDPLPRRVVFARERIAGWLLEARTDVDEVGGYPMIERTLCEMTRSGLRLTTWPDGGLWIELADRSEEPELGFEREDVRRIALDDRVWEYRWERLDDRYNQFSNVAYSPPRDPCAGMSSHTIILYGCGIPVIHSSERLRRLGGPWISAGMLANHFARARTLRIGFHARDRNGDRVPGPMLRAEIPLAGLGEAIDWCRSAFGSEAARRFHGGLGRE